MKNIFLTILAIILCTIQKSSVLSASEFYCYDCKKVPSLFEKDLHYNFLNFSENTREQKTPRVSRKKSKNISKEKKGPIYLNKGQGTKSSIKTHYNKILQFMTKEKQKNEAQESLKIWFDLANQLEKYNSEKSFINKRTRKFFQALKQYDLDLETRLLLIAKENIYLQNKIDETPVTSKKNLRSSSRHKKETRFDLQDQIEQGRDILRNFESFGIYEYEENQKVERSEKQQKAKKLQLDASKVIVETDDTVDEGNDLEDESDKFDGDNWPQLGSTENFSSQDLLSSRLKAVAPIWVARSQKSLKKPIVGKLNDLK